MLTLAELAARDGVSKPTVSIHVKKLIERQGLRVERDAQGRVRRIDEAHYDELRAKIGHPERAQAPKRKSATPPAPQLSLIEPDSYDEALRRKTWHDAELRRLTLEEARGNLIDRREEADAFDRASTLIRDAVDRLEDGVDELAAAMTRDGSRGMRAAMKRLIAEMLESIVSTLNGEAERLRNGAPEA